MVALTLTLLATTCLMQDALQIFCEVAAHSNGIGMSHREFSCEQFIRNLLTSPKAVGLKQLRHEHLEFFGESVN
ncbi:hypothetical protein BA898_05110 [Spiribacter roseus]|nr:hypothetical protein BA898_05110 [Spiribacter roseus]